MAKAYICDRCEKVYSSNLKYGQRGLISSDIITGVTFVFDSDGQIDEYPFAYDLCDECIGKVIGFINKHHNPELIEKRLRLFYNGENGEEVAKDE